MKSENVSICYNYRLFECTFNNTRKISLITDRARRCLTEKVEQIERDPELSIEHELVQ